MNANRADIIHVTALGLTIVFAFLFVLQVNPKALPFFKVVIGLFVSALAMAVYLVCALLMKIAFRSGAPTIALFLYGFLLGTALLAMR